MCVCVLLKGNNEKHKWSEVRDVIRRCEEEWGGRGRGWREGGKGVELEGGGGEVREIFVLEGKRNRVGTRGERWDRGGWEVERRREVGGEEWSRGRMCRHLTIQMYISVR